MSGHQCQTDRAPMLVGTPFPVNLSVLVALGPALWIRRVLVRAQEGQLRSGGWPRWSPAAFASVVFANGRAGSCFDCNPWMGCGLRVRCAHL